MDAASHTFLFADLVGFTALAEQEGDARPRAGSGQAASTAVAVQAGSARWS
jgi:hypothetical protein